MGDVVSITPAVFTFTKHVWYPVEAGSTWKPSRSGKIQLALRELSPDHLPWEASSLTTTLQRLSLDLMVHSLTWFVCGYIHISKIVTYPLQDLAINNSKRVVDFLGTNYTFSSLSLLSEQWGLFLPFIKIQGMNCFKTAYRRVWTRYSWVVIELTTA